MDAFGIEPFDDEAEIRLWIRGDRRERALTSLAVVERATHRAIGLIRWQKDGAMALIGYALDPRRRREGLMTEALRLAIAETFRDPAIRAIVGHVDPGNRPSLNLLTKLGFGRDLEPVWDSVSRRHLTVLRLARP
jgi:RimJ/RimL family protein N-acetyltransferase